MIIVSNSVQQTLAVGQSISFDNTVLHTGCGESHRGGSGAVKMRANGIYEIHFHGNVGGPTAATAVQMAIQVGGETLNDTLMMTTPVVADELNSVSAVTAVKNCCDYDRITVVNVGAAPLTVAPGASLFVKRIA